MLVFMPLPWDLIYHNLKSSSVSPPTVFFFFRIVLAVLGPLHFQINFRINVSFHKKKKKKKHAAILLGITLNFWVGREEN